MMCSGTFLSIKLLTCQLYSNNDTSLSAETFYCCRMDKYINCLPMRISNLYLTEVWAYFQILWKKKKLNRTGHLLKKMWSSMSSYSEKQSFFFFFWRNIFCCRLSLRKNNFLQVSPLGSCLYLEYIFQYCVHYYPFCFAGIFLIFIIECTEI